MSHSIGPSDPLKTPTKPIESLDSMVVRFAGDSGDGMQLAGDRLAGTSALFGNDISTFPDFPAEIRAPKGTLAGVSGFQVHFAARDIHTPGDEVDILVAMNPAALVQNLSFLRPHGTLIVDEDMFDAKNLKLARIEKDPLEERAMDAFNLIRVPLTSLTRDAVAESGVGRKIATRCRNFFALGLVYWLCGRDPKTTLEWIDRKFGDRPDVAKADTLALRAGWNFGETTEAFERSYRVPPADLPPGEYRNITGNQALALGLITASRLSDKSIFYGSYPITPASDILHELARHKRFKVRTFQAEDEIAAITSAIGAAYGGAMGVTASSGPGIALKTEAMGLAIMLELPLLILSIQRGGPSTGLPTKPEQSDLLQVMFGRSGESPLPVLAAGGPTDCFDIVIEAWRIATRLMTPVVVLSDAFIANGAEPWRIPDIARIPPIDIAHPEAPSADDAPFLPYSRNEWLARPWALPGTPGLAHRVGSLEKHHGTGNVSYDPDNHEKMVGLRARKVANAVHLIKDQEVFGPDRGRLLILSWGGTLGVCRQAVEVIGKKGKAVAHTHLRHLHPLPANLGDILGNYERVLVPEMNSGQLAMILKARYLVDIISLNRVRGRPFMVRELVDAIEESLA
ncbi:2-oxoacid:acceptor oxidoreductase subunit alpha [Thioalkalivibrio sp. HK1]|uniref:2-oxoacid:acceptor oxidoreductase subunit alpha n=1 Tax=Thioalkalivibrio sp. HK1 TaxID=1469245 RepID=UPI00056FB96C|nr:2-oxoacid:acceptor oxidoreductase subunit alpha [Thioalkalivibrio sp. HK1]